MPMNLNEYGRGSDIDYLLQQLQELPESNTLLMPSEWQELKRYLPREVTKDPGMFSCDKAPYVKEILDMGHPDNPATNIDILKSRQSYITTSVLEGHMGFVTDNALGSCLYLTSSKGIGKIRSSSALDVLIDNVKGLAKKLSPFSDRVGRKTSDTTYYKEFQGGVKWLISSYKSIGDIKSNPFQYIYRDEWTEAGIELKDQGDIAGIIEGATLAQEIYKIYSASTPGRLESCRMHKGFIKGDQRLFHVLCPHCKEAQVLVLKRKNMKHGLTFNRTKNEEGINIVDSLSIRYICISCHREIKEIDKMKMLRGGVWVPTWMKTEHIPDSPNHRSYHVSGLMAPGLSWERLLTRYFNCVKGFKVADPFLYKDFVINYLGEPYTQVYKTAEWERFKGKALNYQLGEGPDLDHPLVLLGGADVHKDRIELGIYGFYYGMQIYLVDYVVFNAHKDTSSLQDPCWKTLFDFVYEKSYQIGGKTRNIVQVGIDSGYNPKYNRPEDWTSKANTVIAFCADGKKLFVPVKGVPEQKDNTHEVIKGVRSYHTPGVPIRYNVNTSLVKDLLYSNLELEEGPGSIHFPRWGDLKNKIPLPDEIFQSFLSETFKEDKNGNFNWVKHFARNEVLDTAVYAVSMYFKSNLNLKNLSHFKYLDSF